MRRASLPTSLCTYCGSTATTRDHVPPRLLLERPFPKNLHTVPSCLSCNRGASKDEEYFLGLIAQVSLSPFIGAKLEPGGTLDRAFTRSPAFEQLFLDAAGVDEDTGKPFVRPELPRVTRVVKKIAIGLFALRYGWAPPWRKSVLPTSFHTNCEMTAHFRTSSPHLRSVCSPSVGKPYNPVSFHTFLYVTPITVARYGA